MRGKPSIPPRSRRSSVTSHLAPSPPMERAEIEAQGWVPRPEEEGGFTTCTPHVTSFTSSRRENGEASLRASVQSRGAAAGRHLGVRYRV